MFAPANTAEFSLFIEGTEHDFKVLSFKGKEGMNQPFSINVELVSERPNLKLDSFLHQAAFLQIAPGGVGIHGRVYSIGLGTCGFSLMHYHLELVPSLSYLEHSYNQRIFQHMTVPQILAQVLKEHGILHKTHVIFQFGPTVYPEREYCVQFAESDLHFVHRLCEEAGIHFHFRHSANSHLLVFGDDQTVFQRLAPDRYAQGAGMVADRPVIKHFSVRLAARTSQVSRRDYDFEQPRLTLESDTTSSFTPVLEDYAFPGHYTHTDRGKHITRRVLERHRSDYQLAQGRSDQPALCSGHFLELTGHPRAECNTLWLLTAIEHEGRQPQVLEQYAAERPEVGKGELAQGYRNTFEATPWETPYRPALTHLKPRMSGSQTAKVVGPVGEEIHCDRFGRVKICFPWDRREQNDQSSCWLRVASNWAGLHYGSVTIPRVGMEVEVSFLQGDPDQPFVTACLHHAETPVPYPLPEHKTRTVFRSQSTQGSGGYNELHVEDRQGAEKIYLRAERDLEQYVQHDYQLDVANESRTTVNKDRIAQLESNDFLNVAQTLVYQVGNNVHIKSGANIIFEAASSLTLKAGGEHIHITGGGIFSSRVIETGDAPSLLAQVPRLQAPKKICVECWRKAMRERQPFLGGE
ncbi:type VI secretion system tip protein TssI/VgrG [Pseudomonas sp. NPDC098747]|uniref:type VI secretion system tip protein TssI/VgrG n=1 Tax=Pseudomonas sp. NPDC098747 TaxID=3364487 RepID=UPI00383A82F8